MSRSISKLLLTFIMAISLEVSLTAPTSMKPVFHQLDSKTVKVLVDSNAHKISVDYKLRTTNVDDTFCESSTTMILGGFSNCELMSDCYRKLYLFSPHVLYSNQSNTLAHHCELKTKTVNNSSSIVISDLLSSSVYEMQVAATFNEKDVKAGVSAVYGVCTMKDVPEFSPQADLGSFEVLSIVNNTKKILLRWREVPDLISTRLELTYTVNCTGEGDSFHFVEGIREDHLTVDNAFDSERGFLCEIKSRNRIGISKSSTYIQIPRTHLSQHVTLNIPSNRTDRLTWTDFKENSSDTYYILYVCIDNDGCRMLRSDEAYAYLDFSSLGGNNLSFALSYSSPNSTRYSGIIYPYINEQEERTKRSNFWIKYLSWAVVTFGVAVSLFIYSMYMESSSIVSDEAESESDEAESESDEAESESEVAESESEASEGEIEAAESESKEERGGSFVPTGTPDATSSVNTRLQEEWQVILDKITRGIRPAAQ